MNLSICFYQSLSWRYCRLLNRASFTSIALYFWEFNVRASTVLGVVGAGGIGQELKNSMDLLDFSRLLTILVIISIMVMIIDRVSVNLQRRLQ